MLANRLCSGTVAVQWEDGGPWICGTIAGMGNHNHHSRSYKIQVTNTQRIITHNRQHIKPMPIRAEDYMHYQSRKHTKKTDSMPFWTTFKKIHIHTQTRLFLTKEMTIKIHMMNTELAIHSQGSRQEQIEEISDSTGVDKDNINEGKNIVKTRYRRIVPVIPHGHLPG